jgi:hypothetical protein
MSTHYKTVETKTDPAFIITNDLSGNGDCNGAVLLLSHFYDGSDDKPKVTMDTDGVVYIERDDIKKLIAALEEFL